MEKIEALIRVENTLNTIDVKGEQNLRSILGCIEVVRNVRQQLQADLKTRELQEKKEEEDRAAQSNVPG